MYSPMGDSGGYVITVPLEDVKPRLGIFYSTPEKDREVSQMVASAEAYFKGAGWDVASTPGALAVEAVATWCKMAQSTDPSLLTNHPVLLSFIVQGRSWRDSV